MNLREPRPRQPLAALAVWAVVGIFAADRWAVEPWWTVVLVACGGLALLWRASPIGVWLFCGAAFFSLHTLRHHGHAAKELAREFAAGPRVVRVTGIVWEEPEPPAFWSRTVKARFRMKLESISFADEARAADSLVEVSWAGEQIPVYGDRVSLTGSGTNLEPTRNPGQFDAAAYAQRQGVWSEIRARFATDCRIESHGHGHPAQTYAFQAAHWIQRQLALDLEGEPEIAGLITSMVLGLRGETPPQMKALFQRTGTMHLFAVSGLNVAMLAAIAIFLLRRLRLGRVPSIVATIPILVGYALVTGLTASCVRATIMCSLVLIAYLVDRRPLVFNSLGAAALGILGWDTNQLFSPGFQFSFVLVLVIVWLSAKIQRRLEPLGRPDAFLPRALWRWPQHASAAAAGKCAAALGVTISAWLGSLLFTAGYFHLVSPSALLANMLAVPLAFVVLVLGIATLLTAPVWKMGALLCNNANWFCAKALLAVLKVCALVPGGWIYVETPALASPPAAEITVLDLADGGAAHLRAGGRDWLFDCGSEVAYEHLVLPYLRTRGVNRLDGFLLSHGDVKHLGGAIPLLDDFQPCAIVDSVLRDKSSSRKTFHAELARRSVGKGLYARGDTLRLSPDATVRVLYPPAGLQRAIADDKALILQLEAAGTRILFMFDSGFATEQWLVENESDLRSDIVIKGQHAKDLSGTLDFLACVQPDVVISTALGYGDPVEPLDVWERSVAERGIIVFRQDRTGAVKIVVREKGFVIEPRRAAQIFRSRAR
ncbi:MAG: ComEC/Rec2 family competence protein [Chthoniobacter sp.]|nr:ComEC/Rec2 family competence protein [Chthoniobacter sp.]